MNAKLKQRLIGAIALIALAVILVPMILDGPVDQEPMGLNIGIPPEPEFIFESELPDPGQLDDLPALKKEEVKQQASVDKKTQTKTQDDPGDDVKPVADPIQANPSLSAWVVQVGAFGEKDKAVALKKKLLADKYPAFTEKLTSGNKLVYRVKVGPELDREKAEKLRASIEKEHGLTGTMVISHP